MPTISFSRQFRRDYQREMSGRHGKRIESLINEVIDLLLADNPLPKRYFDHPLIGNWANHRDCHLRPDLVLIYRKLEGDVIEFIRLGSHSELSI